MGASVHNTYPIDYVFTLRIDTICYVLLLVKKVEPVTLRPSNMVLCVSRRQPLDAGTRRKSI